MRLQRDLKIKAKQVTMKLYGLKARTEPLSRRSFVALEDFEIPVTDRDEYELIVFRMEPAIPCRWCETQEEEAQNFCSICGRELR